MSRRSSDSQLDVIVGELGEMRAAIRDMANAVQKIAVIEERMSFHGQTMERAFREIAGINATLRDRDDNNAAEHAAFKRSINIATGGGIVIQMIAGIVIMYCVSIISGLESDRHQIALDIQSLKSGAAQHAKEDQIQSSDDVRRVLESMKQGATPP